MLATAARASESLQQLERSKKLGNIDDGAAAAATATRHRRHLMEIKFTWTNLNLIRKLIN